MKGGVLILTLLATIVSAQTATEQHSQPSHASLPAEGKKDHKQDAKTTTPTIVTSEQATPVAQHNEEKNSHEAIDVDRQLARFTLYLVLVGVLQSIVLAVQAALFWQQKKIMSEHKVSLEQLASAAGNNVDAIKAQGLIMDSQLNAMQGQLTAIENQNRTMEDSVAVARESASIARLSAEAAIEKERARLKIVVDKINPQVTLNSTICQLENYGLSPAFISEVKVRFLYCLPRDIVPDCSMCRTILYAESLQSKARTNGMLIPLEPSNFSMDEESLMKIKKEQAFLHFYGIVKYLDVFKRDRTATIHVRWTMRWGGVAEGMITQWWEPVGEPSENTDE